MNKHWITLVAALMFLGGALTYRNLEPAKDMELDSPVQIEAVVNKEIEIINALATKLKLINEDRNVDKHGQGVMNIISIWLEVKRAKNQFTADEQAAGMNNCKVEIQKALKRLKEASAPIGLYKGGKSLMAQIGSSLNAIKPPAASADNPDTN